MSLKLPTSATTILLLYTCLKAFLGQPRKAGTRKVKKPVWIYETRDDGVLEWQWHQLDHMQIICTSLQTDNHNNTISLNFDRPDALHDAQPTVSKH